MSETQLRQKQELLLTVAASRLAVIEASAGTLDYYQQKFHWLYKPMKVLSKPLSVGLSLAPALLAGLRSGRQWKKEQKAQTTSPLQGAVKQVVVFAALSLFRSLSSRLFRR